MFVFTYSATHILELLIAMALGVPCIAPPWPDDCERAVRSIAYPEISVHSGILFQLDAVQDRQCSL